MPKNGSWWSRKHSRDTDRLDVRQVRAQVRPDTLQRFAKALACWNPGWDQWAQCRRWMTIRFWTPPPRMMDDLREFVRRFHRRAKISEGVADGFAVLVGCLSWRQVEYVIAWQQCGFICRKAAQALTVSPSSCEEAIATAKRRIQATAVKYGVWFEPFQK